MFRDIRFGRFSKALTKTFSILIAAACLTWPAAFVMGQAGATTKPLMTVDAKDISGRGAALSPDGQTLVYVGTDGLHLRDLTTNADKLLAKEASPGADTFYGPSFSFDGRQILVSAAGPTRSWPCDVYSIAVDGSGIQKLTTSVDSKETGFYDQYYYSALPSLSSFALLVEVTDKTAGKEVGIIDDKDKPLRIVVQGIPLGWAEDDKAFYYRSTGKKTLDKVFKYDLRTQESSPLRALPGRVLGKVPHQPRFAVDGRNEIRLESLTGGKALPVLFPRHIAPLHGSQTQETSVMLDGPRLESMQWSQDGSKLLLVYYTASNEHMEILESKLPAE